MLAIKTDGTKHPLSLVRELLRLYVVFSSMADERDSCEEQREFYYSKIGEFGLTDRSKFAKIYGHICTLDVLEDDIEIVMRKDAPRIEIQIDGRPLKFGEYCGDWRGFRSLRRELNHLLEQGVGLHLNILEAYGLNLID